MKDVEASEKELSETLEGSLVRIISCQSDGGLNDGCASKGPLHDTLDDANCITNGHPGLSSRRCISRGTYIVGTPTTAIMCFFLLVVPFFTATTPTVLVGNLVCAFEKLTAQLLSFLYIQNLQLLRHQTLPQEQAPKSLTSGNGVAVELEISVLGDPIKVWGSIDTWNTCKLLDVPDIPTRAFAVPNPAASGSSRTAASNSHTINMIQGSTNFHVMTGPSLFNVTRSCDVAWNKTGNADPSMFAANEFLDSTVLFPNGTVIALSHTEYPGNRYSNCPGPAYPYCWTVTTGMMVSYDYGNTWQHAKPPPHHLVAAVPYVYNTSQLASGWGDPSNIMKHPTDGFYYVAMWNRNLVGLQQPGVCLMRTNSLLEPSSWRGWNGTHYSVTFVSPYNHQDDPTWNPADHVCNVLAVDSSLLDPTKCNPFGLVWSPSLMLFLMTWACLDGDGPFFITTSPDLVHWSAPQSFYDKSMLPTENHKEVTSMHYPNFMDAKAPMMFDDPNYSSISSRPHLFWVSFGHNAYVDGRSSWATPLNIKVKR